jgi:Major Facilitator Superfamily
MSVSNNAEYAFTSLRSSQKAISYPRLPILNNWRASVEFRIGTNFRNPAPSKWFTAMPAYPWLVMSITCIGAFMGQLDASIVQLTLPELERGFHATLASVSWVAIGYLLSYAVTLPVFARASEIFGRKQLYIAGYAVFAAASLLCGLATSLPILIGCRLLHARCEQHHNPD